MNPRLPLLVTFLVVALPACQQQAGDSAVTNPLLTGPVPDGMVRGTVVETMASGGYTYVALEIDGDIRWIAGPPTTVATGDVVLTSTGAQMTGFPSRSLGRTFDVIYFVGAIENLSAPVAAATDSALPQGHPRTEADAATIDEIDVEALDQGHDIAWLYANRESLGGQAVTLRGQVVKYNSGILGKNFFHLQDGSGDATEGTNDLTVTSLDETEVGATVVVTGTIVLDKDFGAGYTFPLLLEDAAIKQE